MLQLSACNEHSTVVVTQSKDSVFPQSSQCQLSSRKRKMHATQSLPSTFSYTKPHILPRSLSEKRLRKWTEMEYEEMLADASLLREELELLMCVACDLCMDLSYNTSKPKVYMERLSEIEDFLASLNSNDMTEKSTVSIRNMCRDMGLMMQYLCSVHFDHYALVEMQDELRHCRMHCTAFEKQYGRMFGF